MNPKLAAFIRLARLKFLIGGFSGAALGTAIAVYESHTFDLRGYVLAQITITAAHLMTQFANDYYDRESDARTTRTPYSGGSGVLVDGSLAPVVALRAALACLALSAAGIAASFATGHALAGLLGIAIVVLAWTYSAPPVRLLARGLGELDTAVVVAMLVPLCAYAAQARAIDALAVASTLPGAVAMFVMMLCVQMPDIAADAATGKRNLVVRLGSRRIAQLAWIAIGLFFVAIFTAKVFGSPLAFVAALLAVSVEVCWVARAFVALGARAPIPASTLARRGVIFFVSVSAAGALGYAIALFRFTSAL